jgi:hypothetical protein
LKKLAIIGFALAALLAMTAVAVAQVAEPVITPTANVTPTNGGTKKKPKNAKIRLAFTVNKESRKTLSGINYYVPANITFSGKGFPSCSASKINSSGEGSCPKGSKVGSGTATAVLGPSQQPLNFTVNVYSAGNSALALALKGAVEIAFAAPITPSSSPYGQKLAVTIPASVQSPAPGLYSYVTSVDTTIGGTYSKKVTKKVNGKKKKVKVTYRYASLTGCPSSGAHTAAVQLLYQKNDTGEAGESPIVPTTSDCSK